VQPVAALAAKHIRHPDLRPGAAGQVLHHTTALAITQAPAVAAAASNGSCARASMLLVAPSLPDARAPSGMASGIERPNGSSVSAASRSSPMAWA